MSDEPIILSYIPQRPPFVLVDEVLSSQEFSTRTKFLVSADNIFVEDGILKEPALVENIAQTAAARAGYISAKENNPVRLGYIGAINNLKIFGLPKVGDELITEIKIVNQVFNVMLISGSIMCNDQVIAQCEMKIFIS